MKYRIIDKNARDVRAELKEYTFEELKAYFEPNKEDLAEEWEKWSEVTDLFDLKWYLEYEYDGMEVPYEFEEVQTASMSFKELRISSGMNKTEFAKYFNVPYRTIQNWDAGVRECPEYLMELMEYKLNNERKGGTEMTKERQIEILMKDRCSKSEAEAYIKRGCTIYDDFEENFDAYMEEWDFDEDEIEKHREMIEKKIPTMDWGIVEENGKYYYIEYVN